MERGGFCVSPARLIHHHFEAEVYILSKEEGGRHTPFFSTIGILFSDYRRDRSG